MCGIAGCISPPGAGPDRAALERMARALAHRGPDDHGVEVVGQVGLVHTRLSIVDPSPAGHAPMALGGRWWLTYNGEVFNHHDLRAELGARAWRGGSDTETLLHALDAWGKGAVPRCNGLFAFAALDAERRRVLLARDRFGVKPLYLARHGGALWFASEVGALLAAGVASAPRPDVLAHAIGYGWAEGPQTPFAEIDRLAPGTTLEVNLDTLADTALRWYDPADAVDPERMAELAGRGREDLAGALEDELRASVRRRLMADVPVGTMCSGGLDSSLVTALAREEHPRIVAYNAAVTDQPGSDEGPWARLVTRELGVELRTAPMDAAAWRGGLVRAVRHHEFPLMHESSVPMAMIAALAHADGVKVLLSGEGADELFAGYDFLHAPEYRAVVPARARLSQQLQLARARAGELRRRGDGGLWRGMYGRAFDRRRAPAFLPPWAASVAAHAEAVRERARRAYAHHPGPPGELEAALLGDLSTYLPHLLNRQDKNTMQASIETRVPFLDPAVVALALNLPLSARTQPLRKGVLRDLGARHLPPAVARRAKVGFGFDVRRYLAPASRPEFLRDGVLRDTLAIPREQWDALAADGASPGALRLWSGEIWCRMFLESADEATVEAALWR